MALLIAVGCSDANGDGDPADHRGDERVEGLEPIADLTRMGTGRPVRIGEALLMSLPGTPEAAVAGVKIEEVEIIGLSDNAEIIDVFVVRDSPEHPVHGALVSDPYPVDYPLDDLDTLPRLSPGTPVDYYYAVAIRRTGPGKITSAGVNFIFELGGKRGAQFYDWEFALEVTANATELGQP